MLKKIVIALSLLPQFAGAANVSSGELIKCTRDSGGAKTGCTANQKLWTETSLSDFTVKYTYDCRKIFSTSAPAFASSSVPTSSAPAAIVEGANRQVVIREAKEVHFGFIGSGPISVSSDCSVNLLAVVVTPAESVIEGYRKDAKRYQDLLQARLDVYKSVIDYDSLIQNYTIPQLNGMSSSLETIFGMVLEQALGEMGSQPAGYGLPYSDWSEFKVLDQGLITLNPQEGYLVSVNPSRQPYYFDAKDNLPLIANVLTQIATVKNATRIKEAAAAGGYQLPDATKALKDLTDLRAEVNTFLGKIAAVKSRLLQEYNNLNSSYQNSDPSQVRGQP